jgi:hypothetical protein
MQLYTGRHNGATMQLYTGELRLLLYLQPDAIADEGANAVTDSEV